MLAILPERHFINFSHLPCVRLGIDPILIAWFAFRECLGCSNFAIRFGLVQQRLFYLWAHIFQVLFALLLILCFSKGNSLLLKAKGDKELLAFSWQQQVETYVQSKVVNASVLIKFSWKEWIHMWLNRWPVLVVFAECPKLFQSIKFA